MGEDSQLLFFDTFTHDNEEEYLDLVNFKQWVYITEIRVIPLNYRIHADFGGSNFRLGATNPSKFKLEFFVNDYNKKNACTFQSFGAMNYQQNFEIQFMVSKKIVTDCLVVRGKYNLLTLAIYGYKAPKKKSSPPPPQPPPGSNWEIPQQVKPIVTTSKYSSESYSYDRNKSFDHSDYELQSSWNSEPGKEEKTIRESEERRVVRWRDSSERNKSEKTRSYSGEKPKPTRVEPAKPPVKVSQPKTPPDPQPSKEEEPPVDEKALVPPSSPPHSPPTKSGKNHPPHHEEHTEANMLGSDVEMVSEDEHLDCEMIEDEEIDAEYNITFKIYQCEFCPLKFFHSPCLTKFEIKKAINEHEDSEPICSLLKEFRSAPHTDKWVLAIEALKEIPWSLSDDEFSELVSWVVEGLDKNAALSQPQVLFKVRHIKAGIHLASLLFFTEPSVIQKLLNADVPFKLLDLLDDPHISVFMKLHVIQALDLVLLTQEGLTYLTTAKREQGLTVYQRLLQRFMKTIDSRSAVVLKAMLKKIHLYEVLLKLENSTQVLVESCKNHQLLDKSHLEAVNGALIIILDYLSMTKQHLAPPHQYLPAKHQFTIPDCSYNPFQMLYRMLKDNHLIENLSALLSCHPINQDINKNAHNLLIHFQSSQQGLLFLLSNPKPLEGLYQALLHIEDPPESLACHLQVLQAVDWLMAHNVEIDEKGHAYDLDDPETVEYLKILNGLVFLTSGKQALANVLAMENNLDALLPFLQFTNEDEHNQKLTKSVSPGYATELLLLTVHLSENVSYLQNFKSLFIQFEPQDQMPRLQELSKWFLPFKDINIFTSDCIPTIMGYIKDMEDQADNLPIEIILCLRILKALVAADNSSQLEELEELKHKYALFQIFTHDGLSIFLRILQVLHKAYLQPFQQSYALSGHQGTSLLSLVGSIVNLINLMLSCVIKCRGAEFRDLTPIFTLLHIYCLMSLVPVGPSSLSVIGAVQTQVLDTLLAYTQPSLDSTESDDALSQSLWTEMLREVLRFTVLSPSNFMTGLTVLIELLPQMLPLPTHTPLADEEVVEMLNHRKLWSAHLLPLSSSLYDMIQSLSTTTSTTMLHHLRCVCLQLCDLATPTALIVLRAILDAIEHHSPNLTDLSPVSTRILFFSSYLIGHPSFKMPFLALWRGAIKAEEKYVEVINKIVKLFGAHNDRPYQEALVIFLQMLCDPEIGFFTSRTETPLPQILVCNLPGPSQLTLLISSLLQFIGNTKPNQNCLPSALRTLIMLSEHDYGFFYLKQSLELNSDSMYNLLCTCKHMYSKDNPESLNIISIVLDLLRQLFLPDGSRLSSSQLRKIVRWNHKDHPLLELKQVIVEEEEFTRIMNGLVGNQEGCLAVEPKPPLPNLYSRPVFVVQADIDEDPESFTELPEQDVEQMEVDLLSISQKYFPNFDICQRLESLTSLNQGASDKHKPGSKRPLDTINPSAHSDVVLPFIAPMRGSGLVSRGASHSTRPNDPFRSRPPNTSRPPSTHVDDFLGFDGGSSCKRILKDLQARGRGGRGVFMQGIRGRNFSTPGSSTYLPRRETAQMRPTWMTRSHGNSSKSQSRNIGPRGSLQEAPRGLLPTPRSRENSPPRLSRATGHWPDHRFDSSSTQNRRDLQARHSRSFNR